MVVNSIHSKSKRVLAVVTLLASLLIILAPSVLSALVWTSVNLIIILPVVIVALSLFRFRLKAIVWVCNAATAALISFPPYPYWISFDEAGHIKFAAMDFSLSSSGANFLLLFLSMGALFAAGWALRTLKEGRSQGG